MQSATYLARRGQLEMYFDRTASEAWSRLTSDAPVSGIRATVRAGRDRMRSTLLGWLPGDLGGRRVLDAGCGTGALSVEAARRGAHVVAIDLSAKLVEVASERVPTGLRSMIVFHVGDMTEADLGRFDHVIGMDSLIHYSAGDMVRVVSALVRSCATSMAFTFAPCTPLLSAMHVAGKLFPRGDRVPAIEPVSQAAITRRLSADVAMCGWQLARTQRIANGFYISQALELVRT